jgi:hypothetical protein
MLERCHLAGKRLWKQKRRLEAIPQQRVDKKTLCGDLKNVKTNRGENRQNVSPLSNPRLKPYPHGGLAIKTSLRRWNFTSAGSNISQLSMFGQDRFQVLDFFRMFFLFLHELPPFKS